MDIRGKKIHFMGAGGIGVSALAGIALDQGAVVSGCDRADNEQLAMLGSRGAQISIGHAPEHALDCDRLVYTSAIPLDHPELLAAGGKAVRRGSFLAELLGSYRGVGIAGTHGKTSTTWMTAHILLENRLDPTVLLGGVTRKLQGNFHCGGEIFVSELDESDGSFLEPELEVAVITNIESEHLAYYGTFEKEVEAFELFAEKSNTGLLILGTDNPVCSRIYAEHAGRKKAFGFDTDVGLSAGKVRAEGGKQVCEVRYAQKKVADMVLPLTGRHNILNALAALLAAEEFGVSLAEGIKTLSAIETVGRRMELIHTLAGTRIYSDYAHHPTEIRAALAGARELDASGKIMAVFQPHLYTRTRDYAQEFARELAVADRVVVVELYPAREEPIAGVDSELIRREIRAIGGRVDSEEIRVDEINDVIQNYAGDYSTIVCIGAGDMDAELRKISIN